MVTPPSWDIYEDQLDEIPEDGLPRNDSNSKSLKSKHRIGLPSKITFIGFPNIITQNRKTKFQLKPVFDKDRNSLDL